MIAVCITASILITFNVMDYPHAMGWPFQFGVRVLTIDPPRSFNHWGIEYLNLFLDVVIAVVIIAVVGKLSEKTLEERPHWFEEP